MKVSSLSQSSRSSNNVSGTSLPTLVTPSVSHQCFTVPTTLRTRTNFSSPAGCGQTLSRGLSKGAVQSQRRPPCVSQNIPGSSGSQTCLHGFSKPGRWIHVGGNIGSLAHCLKVWLVFQVKRVPVSTCSSYTTLQDCWSAQDPYCVWCSSENRLENNTWPSDLLQSCILVVENTTFSFHSCTYEEACGDSAWLSIPEESQHKMVSYEVVKTTDEVLVTLLTLHLFGI